MNDFDFPKQSKSQESGRKGEVFFENFVTNRLGWIYRPVPQESDFGIDGYIDIVEDGKVTGKSIAVQVKCGNSYTSKKTKTGIKYNGENKHLNYYINLTTPIILVVLSSDFSSSYWIEFSIELTSPSQSGWWIEIPRRNMLDNTVLSKWKEIAGPSSDFSEAIKHEWLLDSTIKESDYTCFWIPKIEVEQGSYDHINGVIRKLSKNHELLLSRRCTLDIFFPEYDNDSRELYEIPEVRKWFKGSIEEGIPWFYFLSTKGPAAGLKLLLFCVCNVKFLGASGGRQMLEVDVKERSKWLMENFHNLNVFTEENEISIQINKECCDSIVELLCNLFK